MKEGKIRAVIEETYEFQDVPKALSKLKEGRIKGKIVVHISKDQVMV
jgi:D-arabinose 1-dehydrogenase-like Zn-dependent alcohol dehydrogenase